MRPLNSAMVWPALAATGWEALLRLPSGPEKFMEHPLFHIGELAITPWFLVKAFVFLAIVAVLARATSRFLVRRILPHTSMERGQQFVLARWTEYAVFSIGVVIGLQTSGLNLSSLLVVGGALGVGIGFGLQNVANNFISGLILLVEQPIRVGHVVEVGGVLGVVTKIGARSTWVRTLANAVIIVPNSEFVSGRVTNWTAGGSRVLVHAKVGVGYASDAEKVRDILLAVARENPAALADPAPAVLFSEFGDSSLNFNLYAWFPGTAMQSGRFASDLNFAILDALRRNNIEIPFPQHDLHVRTVEPPVTVRSS